MKTFSVQWLSEQIRHHSDTVLLLDTRCSEEYASGCVLSAVNVYCCGALILRRLKKGNVSVESLLSSVEDKTKYSKAKESEAITVIVYDEGSTSYSDLASDSLTALLLKKLSREVKNFGFLEGGYNDFNDSYPRLCSEGRPKMSADSSKLQHRPSSLVLKLDNLTVVSDSSDSSSDSCSEGESSGSPPSLTKVPPQPFEILSHLYLGCRKAASDKEALKAHSISRVLNVTSEESQYQHLEGFSYYQIAVEDTHEVDMLQHLPMAFAFIEEARLANEKVLVHCHAGMSRSVTVVISYLMKYYDHSLNSAYDYVRQKKSNISPNFSFLQQLIQFESSLRSSPSDSGIDSESCSPIDNHYTLKNVFTSTSSSTSPPTNFRRCILAA